MRTLRPEHSFAKALKPCQGSTVRISGSVISRAVEMSRQSPRRRIILPFHAEDSDTLQRMLNAIQPGSYIQPHRHLTPPKAESLIVLRGSIGYVTFENDGTVQECFVLSAGSDTVGVDTKPGIYHTFFALEEDTVLFEVKPGPYVPQSDKAFASWAPREGSKEGADFLESLQRLLPTSANGSSNSNNRALLL